MPRSLGNYVRPHDTLAANLLSAGSTLASVFPARLNFIGRADAPSYTPVRWSHWPRPADELRDTWAEFEGIETAGRTPRHYGQAAILLVDREKMDQLRGRGHPRRYDAVTYGLGSAVMVGMSFKHEILGLEHADDVDYRVALRIGKGPLEAGVGVYDAAGVKRSIYTALEEGVRPGPTMPIAEVPDAIPLL
jgi:hypothetical protein